MELRNLRTFQMIVDQGSYQKAAEMLAGNIKISEISQKLGYQSRNRFFINFKQFSGYSPTDYRRQILCMDEPE